MASIRAISGFVVLLFASISATLADFPLDPKPCKFDDEACFIKTADYYYKEKFNGDNSLNLPSIDPITVKKIHLKGTPGSSVDIDLLFTDNEIVGLKAAKTTKVKGFGKDLTTEKELAIRIPVISLVGPYKVNGKILILPIQGEGRSNFTMYDVEAGAKFHGTPFEKDGETYMKIEQIEMEVKPRLLVMNIENLFNGDKELGENMNRVLNENWKDLYNEIRPQFSKAFGGLIRKVFNQVFATYPYKKLLTE